MGKWHQNSWVLSSEAFFSLILIAMLSINIICGKLFSVVFFHWSQFINMCFLFIRDQNILCHSRCNIPHLTQIFTKLQKADILNSKKNHKKTNNKNKQINK